MAQSINIVHEMVNKLNWDIESIDVKRVVDLAEKAGELMSKGLTKEAGVAFDEIGEMFNKKLKEMGKSSIDFTDMIKMPDTTTLEKMTSGFTEAIAKNISNGIAEGLKSSAAKTKAFMKDSAALREAYEKRNKNASGAKTGKHVRAGFVNKVKGAFDYEPSETAVKIGANLKAITNEYNKAANWEDQYVALLKYIKAYEALEKISHDPKTLEKWSSIGEYAIQDIKEARPEIEHSLQNIFNVAYDKAVSGLTNRGEVDLDVKLTPIRMIDVYDVVGKKGHIEVPVKIKPPKIKEWEAFRAVQRPQTDNGRADALEYFGAEYWATSKHTAASYTEEHDDVSSIIESIIKPINPLIIDAKEALWYEFEKMPGLKEVIPGLSEYMKNNSIQYDHQKYINEQARLLGFDAVILKNVQDDSSADRDDNAPIDTTIAVLDDRIVSLTGAFAELEGQVDENGIKMFSQAKSDIPDFYIKPDDLTPDQHLERLYEQQHRSEQFLASQMPLLEQSLKTKEEAFLAAKQKYEAEKTYTNETIMKRAQKDYEYMKSFVPSLKQNLANNQKMLTDTISYYTSLRDNTSESSASDKSSTKQLLTQTEALEKLAVRINSTGKQPSQFFDDIIADSQLLDKELKDILQALGMLDGQGGLNLASIRNGFSNLGGAVSDTYAIISRTADYLPKSQDLMPKLIDAESMGANVGTIVDVFEDKVTGRIYELQKTMPGTIIPDNTEFLEATDAQILKLIKDLEILHKTGLYIDFGGDNILYDQTKGFSFIDLATRPQEGQENVAGTVQELINSIKPVFDGNELFGKFENNLINIAHNLGVEIPRAAQTSLNILEQYKQASDEVKKKYQEIAVLLGEMDKLEAKAQKTPIDMDPWNATKEQKDQIVAAWREYQKVIQEIAAMPIVETEDDEKRLLELKAKAVGLYETMQQGHLNDVLGDGYAREYGLSAEEGRQMHMDMQDEPRQDFNKALTGLSGKLNAAYTEAYKLNSEMFNMASHLSKEDADNFFERIRQDALATQSVIEAVGDAIEETAQPTKTQTASQTEKENALLQRQKQILEQILALQSEEDLLVVKKDQSAEYYQQKIDKLSELANLQEHYQLLGGELPNGGFKYSEEQLENAQRALVGARETADAMKKLANLKTAKDPSSQMESRIENENNDLDTQNEKLKENIDLKNKASTQGSEAGTGSGDASSIELEAARAEADRLRAENDALQDRVQKILDEAQDDEYRHQQARSELYSQWAYAEDEKEQALQRAQAAEEELAKVREELNDKKLVDKDAPDNANEIVSLQTQLEDERNMRIATENALGGTLSENWEAQRRATDAELEAERLRNELATVKASNTDGASTLNTSDEQQQLTKLKSAVNDVTDAVKAKTQEFLNEQAAVKKAAQSEVHALGEVEKKVTAIRVALSNVNTLLNNVTKGKDISAGLSNITVNVNHKKDEENKGVSIDKESLKQTLGEVIYRVKIAHDDNDKQANKIAIDEPTLERVLRSVFTDRLKIYESQDDIEPKNESRAVEKTPQTAVGNVLATENTLLAIKTAVEAINGKVIKGTKATISGNGEKHTSKKKDVGNVVLYENKEDDNTTSQNSTKNDEASLKLLADISLQRKNLEKFVTQLQTAGKLTDEYQVWIDNLTAFLNEITSTGDMTVWKKAFQYTKTSVGIDDIVGKVEDKETVAAYQQLIEFQKLRNELELKYTKAQDGSPVKQFYAEQLEQMDQVIAKQQDILDNEEYAAKIAKLRVEQERKLGEAEAKAADRQAKKDAADRKKRDKREAMTGKAGSAVGRAESVWMEAEGLDKAKLPDGFKQQIEEYYDALDKLRTKLHEVNTADEITDEDKTELIEQTKNVNQLTQAVGGLVSEYKKLSGANVNEDKSRTTSLTEKSGLGDYAQELKQYVRDITDGKGQIKNFNAETKTLTYTVKTGKNEFTEYTAAVRHLDHQLVSVQGTTKRTETFFEATVRKMKEISSYMSGMSLISRAGQELRRGIQYVREIDLALTELKKVTDETEEEYDKFLDTAAKTGARLGTTISAVTEATATFAKLGYTMEQATEMAEAAIVYKNVGDNIASTEDAADSIISTMKGFGLEASEAMVIVDKFNEVGNRFAITSQGIGEALRLSASALSEGSNSLDESIALITAANEVVNDPSAVGTALKTLTLRLRGSKTELQEMGEDVTDMATTTSQLQAKLLALTGGQVDIMLDANTFKNSTQILREMAVAWEDMNDIQRASALELMGGKRQAKRTNCLNVQKCA